MHAQVCVPLNSQMNKNKSSINKYIEGIKLKAIAQVEKPQSHLIVQNSQAPFDRDGHYLAFIAKMQRTDPGTVSETSSKLTPYMFWSLDVILTRKSDCVSQFSSTVSR